MSWFKKRKPASPPSYMDRVMSGFMISNEHMMNGTELTDAFIKARDLMKSKYARFGCEEELSKTNQQFQWFITSRLIGPTFDRTKYDEQASALVESIIDLAEAFDAKGLDIRPAFKLVTDLIVKDMRLVDQLEH